VGDYCKEGEGLYVNNYKVNPSKIYKRSDLINFLFPQALMSIAANCPYCFRKIPQVATSISSHFHK